MAERERMEKEVTQEFPENRNNAVARQAEEAQHRRQSARKALVYEAVAKGAKTTSEVYSHVFGRSGQAPTPRAEKQIRADMQALKKEGKLVMQGRNDWSASGGSGGGGMASMSTTPRVMNATGRAAVAKAIMSAYKKAKMANATATKASQVVQAPQVEVVQQTEKVPVVEQMPEEEVAPVKEHPAPKLLTEEKPEDESLFIKEAPKHKFYFNKDVLTSLHAMERSENPRPLMLKGAAGVGKTESVKVFAQSEHLPIVRVSCTPNTEDYELIGHEVLRGNDIHFEEGELPNAINKANLYGTAILLVDEINVLQPKYAKAFNSILTERLVQGHKRQWKLNPGAKLLVVGTMNPNYKGVNQLSQELEDRFAVEYIDYPDETEETKILSEYTTNKELIKKLVTFANSFTRNQGSGDDNASSYAVSTRGLINTLQSYNDFKGQGIPEKEAIRLAVKQWILNRYKEDPDEMAAQEKNLERLGL